MIKHKIKGLNVSEFGENNHKTIVFIHAFPLSEDMWKPQVNSLSSEFRILTYDLRGFGSSEYDDGHFTIDMHARDLISLIDSLGLDKPVICGLSMGGYIALRAIELYQNRFSGAVLSNTKSEADNNPAKIKRSEQIIMIRGGKRDEFTDLFLKSALCETTLTDRHEVVTELKRIMSLQKNEAICAALMTLAARTDTTDSLEKVEIPLLIVAGKEDKLVPPEFSKMLYSKTKNSEILIVPECGHFPNLEKPNEFNNAVRNFVSDVFSPQVEE